MRVAEERVANRLNHILIFASQMSDTNMIITWLEVGNESNHLLVLFQMAREECKPPSLFKFNSSWLEDEDFVRLVKANGSHLMPPLRSPQAYIICFQPQICEKGNNLMGN